MVYDSLDCRVRPTRGRSISAGAEFAGLGGSVKFVRLRGKASQYWPVGGGFIFSLSAEGGAIKALGNDGVQLTDRFFLGEPQIRGFDIRGVGPRVIRQRIIADPASPDPTNPLPLIVTDRKQVSDDALGGKYYYLGRAELEIPLGSGAKQLGLRPSVFLDAGALWGVKTPVLQNSPFPGGIDFPIRDASGNALYTQVNVATLVTPTGGGTPICTPGSNAGDVTTVTNPINPNPPSCLAGNQNSALTSNIGPFREIFLGDSPQPRISIGIGVNWNSPFGPFRIDFAHVLMKQPGDDTKRFTFNVGTQF